MKKNNVAIVDGTSILTDAYYSSLPEEVLKAQTEEEKIEAFKLLEKDSNGRYIGAIRGLFSVIFDVVDRLNPTHITVLWGTSRKSNIRKELYPKYKADNSGMDEPLREQFKTAQVLLAPLVKQFTSNKYEAIDLAGTIAHNLKDNATINIFARNKNYLQLTDIANVYIKTSASERLIEEYNLDANEIPTGFFKYTKETLMYVKKLEPSQVLGFNALVGNSSSGIPGVKGVGAITALPIIKKYSTIENLYTQIEQLDAKDLAAVWKSIGVRNPTKKLIEGKEDAFISEDLLTIRKDVYVNREDLTKMTNSLTLNKVASELSKIGLLSETYTSGTNDAIKATSFFGLISLNGTTNVRPIKNNEAKFASLALIDNYNIESELLASTDIENRDEECYSIRVSAPSIIVDNDWECIHNYDDSDDDYDGDCNDIFDEADSDEDFSDDIDDAGIYCEIERVSTQDTNNDTNSNNETISLIETTTIVLHKYKCNCCNKVFELGSGTPVNFCVYCGVKNSSKNNLIDNLEETGMAMNDIKINKDIESVMEYI